MAGLGCLFVVQKRHEHEAVVTKPSAPQAQAAASPRPVSEHNWAKHAIDRTREVTRQVAQQRKEDGVRK
jgi:hypothetical protein